MKSDRRSKRNAMLPEGTEKAKSRATLKTDGHREPSRDEAGRGTESQVVMKPDGAQKAKSLTTLKTDEAQRAKSR